MIAKTKERNLQMGQTLQLRQRRRDGTGQRLQHKVTDPRTATIRFHTTAQVDTDIESVIQSSGRIQTQEEERNGISNSSLRPDTNTGGRAQW